MFFQRKIYRAVWFSQLFYRPIVGISIIETPVAFTIGVVTKCVKFRAIPQRQSRVEETSRRLYVWISPWLNDLIRSATIIRCGLHELYKGWIGCISYPIWVAVRYEFIVSGTARVRTPPGTTILLASECRFSHRLFKRNV